MAPYQDDANLSDPALLQDNSQFKSYTTSRFTYSDLRIFYQRHPQAHELPTSPSPLPLLVCIHGLGGSVAQFHPLLTSLVHLSSCLAIDLPGCGRSRFTQPSWDAYSTDCLIELLETVIDDFRDKSAHQGVVLIGHSMGTGLSAGLADRQARHHTDLPKFITGLIAICPVSGPAPEDKTTLYRRLLWIPGWLFDIWRTWDRRGGTESASVRRFVGEGADEESKRLQYLFNCQSKTPVWRRMAWGSLSTYRDGLPHGGFPGLDSWRGLAIPIFLIGGERDNVTPPKEVHKIAEALDSGHSFSDSDASEDDRAAIVDSAAPINASGPSSRHLERIEDITHDDFARDKQLLDVDDTYVDPSTPQESITGIPPQPRHPKAVVKTIILPPPATHALLYMPATVRILAGLISDFLSANITERLSLGWQLQYLSREGKWDVKNLAKWKGVAPVSLPLGPPDTPIFRAMKTLREVDETHCPAEFVRQWGGTIKDIIDISHDRPVYDPRGLEKGGIQYHKFPTVSKIPPSDAEVDAFLALVDRIRADQTLRSKREHWARGCVIGVHCHYGFNRTGYFIVCYLVDRCKFSVQDAIDAFAAARPNGIRHSHFLDRLFVRYCAGLERPQAALAVG